jgi:hypothetical protein
VTNKPIAPPLKLHGELSMIQPQRVKNAGVELEQVTAWKVQSVTGKIALACSNSNRKPAASGKDVLQR